MACFNFRRKHKKGQEEELTKKRTRRTQKFQRAIVGASLNDILAKRNMKPEVRKAQRDQAIRYDHVFYHCSILFLWRHLKLYLYYGYAGNGFIIPLYLYF